MLTSFSQNFPAWCLPKFKHFFFEIPIRARNHVKMYITVYTKHRKPIPDVYLFSKLKSESRTFPWVSIRTQLGWNRTIFCEMITINNKQFISCLRTGKFCSNDSGIRVDDILDNKHVATPLNSWYLIVNFVQFTNHRPLSKEGTT